MKRGQYDIYAPCHILYILFYCVYFTSYLYSFIVYPLFSMHLILFLLDTLLLYIPYYLCILCIFLYCVSFISYVSYFIAYPYFLCILLRTCTWLTHVLVESTRECYASRDFTKSLVHYSTASMDYSTASSHFTKSLVHC